MELQPEASTDAIPGDGNKSESAAGGSLKTGSDTVSGERTKAT